MNENEQPVESIAMPISETIVSLEPIVTIKGKRGRQPKWKQLFPAMNIGDHLMVKNRAEANSCRTSGFAHFKFRFKTKMQEDGQIRVERLA